MRRTNQDDGQRGLALIMAMILLSMLMVMLLGYFTLSQIGIATTISTMDSIDGLYAAEAGLNLRADLVRAAILTRGGGFAELELKAFANGHEPGPVNLVRAGNQGLDVGLSWGEQLGRQLQELLVGLVVRHRF